jgi:hypothetical protein
MPLGGGRCAAGYSLGGIPPVPARQLVSAPSLQGERRAWLKITLSQNGVQNLGFLEFDHIHASCFQSRCPIYQEALALSN